MTEQTIHKVSDEVKNKIQQANGVEEIEAIRVEYLGRKGTITNLFKTLPSLPLTKRKKTGELLNTVRDELQKLLDEKSKLLKNKSLNEKLKSEKIDITLPSRPLEYLHRHPLMQVISEIVSIFNSLGFQTVTGPEIETDYYNFETLNFPKDHPARDSQDTFYIEGSSDNLLLRTHTSPVQVRTMEKYKPPLYVVVPGKVYRRDASDASHSAVFHQVEGLAVDEKITFAELKGILTVFVHRMFGKGTKTRFRPSFFPFTEPSAEMDIGCPMCSGNGCRVCQNSGWLEMLGCGMVHPKVFDAVQYDREKWTGFAFGMGVERFAMLKFQINEMRLFYENDLRFLKQF
ncbi:MAG: phenylalanine--tRNA ligase subunit alpha [Elusimicrobia bacterium CG1_02_37_114]|nr:MAG: phenylalanine--tRNA ligase subunit alpha [Elusimicrobia bacterium CG1_02_37_114]PIV54050.1 MAG: phenylalanine--tRNA ligase subunit alpha [Elusimicrobia bacterium CG02_land_8_20_14_3_00_37_13]PIZ13402.1 MAG: phenylalanine--tRNA ligase subunit alpha [Elusimicrobia bacterium CG_4_10_14_0_8_um_filter_37_32]